MSPSGDIPQCVCGVYLYTPEQRMQHVHCQPRPGFFGASPTDYEAALTAARSEAERLREALNRVGAWCDGCENPIDPTVCHCGIEVDAHGFGDGHGPVPYGCDCHRDRALAQEEDR